MVWQCWRSRVLADDPFGAHCQPTAILDFAIHGSPQACRMACHGASEPGQRPTIGMPAPPCGTRRAKLFSEGWDRARHHHQQLDRGMTIARE